MGELVGRLDDDFRSNRVDIPWFKIRGLRNKITHDYEGVRLELIWDIVKDDLSVLRGQLMRQWSCLGPDISRQHLPH